MSVPDTPGWSHKVNKPSAEPGSVPRRCRTHQNEECLLPTCVPDPGETFSKGSRVIKGNLRRQSNTSSAQSFTSRWRLWLQAASRRATACPELRDTLRARGTAWSGRLRWSNCECTRPPTSPAQTLPVVTTTTQVHRLVPLVRVQ